MPKIPIKSKFSKNPASPFCKKLTTTKNNYQFQCLNFNQISNKSNRRSSVHRSSVLYPDYVTVHHLNFSLKRYQYFLFPLIRKYQTVHFIYTFFLSTYWIFTINRPLSLSNFLRDHMQFNCSSFFSLIFSKWILIKFELFFKYESSEFFINLEKDRVLKS